VGIKVGCPDQICEPWVYPEDCCNACVDPEDWELFDQWWKAITEWLFYETGNRFPGKCDVESEPCPPCGCRCVDYCGCGPWDTIDLGEAFCQPVCAPNGDPCLEFVFPNEDGTETIYDSDSGLWKLRPDLRTVEWCQPFTMSCGSMWPEQDHCDKPWTVRATVGCPPPDLLLLGAARFICEIIKDCKGEDSCLPDGVRSITRRGITADIGPGFEETINFDTSGTGIPLLDTALRTWNRRQNQPTTFFVDPIKRLEKNRNHRGKGCEDNWTWWGVLKPMPVGSCGE
jgi:hypothetical protein